MQKIYSGNSFTENTTFWTGVIGSLVTIILTIWNAYTKTLIDQREDNLKNLEIKLKERTAGIEESKERVDRYKWVLSLFPALIGKNEKERSFTLNIARLALTKDESEQLFTGLQSSSDTMLRSIGNIVTTAIQNEPIAILVTQMNANTAAVRKSAVADLARNYSTAPQAVTLTLRTYENDNIENLSPSAIINGLYFLSSSEPSAWERKQLINAKRVIGELEKKPTGAQTRAALNTFKAKLQKIESALHE